MAADYDRLFEDPDELPGSDEAAARSVYDLTSPSAEPAPTPPPHLVPTPPPVAAAASPSTGNGQVRAPMPVDWTEQPPPISPTPPATVADTDGAAPPAAPVEPAAANPPIAPKEPVDRVQQTRSPDPAPAPPAQAPGQHGRHSRRAHRDVDDAQDNPVREAAGGPATPPAQAPAAAAAQPFAAIEQPPQTPPRPPARIPAQPQQQPASKPIPGRGWRRAVHATTRINPGLSPSEKREFAQHTRIRRPIRGSYEIGVLGLKGGSGKTAVTAALGSVFAQVRGDRILAVDADQVAGNLVDRVGRQSSATIEALLANDALSHYNDVRAHTSSNAVNLEVLAAAEYRPARHAITDEDWRHALINIPRYYNLVLADCAADFFDPATRSVLSTASGLVIVSSVTVEGAKQVEVAIEWLQQSRYRELLTRACLVLNHVAVGEPGVPVSELTRRFAPCFRPGRIVAVPWDKHVATGTELQLDQLGGTFTRTIIELAAALSDDFDRSESR